MSLPYAAEYQADACDLTGRKDVTTIARFAGRMTGQAAGYVSAIRSKFSAFTETSELTDVRTELILCVALSPCLNAQWPHCNSQPLLLYLRQAGLGCVGE